MNQREHDASAPTWRSGLSAKRAAGAVLGLALLASSCSSTETGSSAADEQEKYDAAPVTAGAAWLASQSVDGVVHNDQYDIDDYGLGVDIALALDAVDAEPSTVSAISDQLAEHVTDYTSPGYGTLTSAGSTAKAVLLAQAVEADPTTYGGRDLVAQLEDTVAVDAPVQGRIQDKLEAKNASAADYANVIGQAYTVLALDTVESDKTGAAADFLVAQQCEEGWFRLDFNKDTGASDQSCDGDPASAPDIDATAFAVRALSTQNEDPPVAASVDSAVAWLKEQQEEDGSFGGGTSSATPNSNSTGLAGQVLADAGETAIAARAAVWVLEHQTVNSDTCQPYDDSDLGAIAYDDAALDTAAKRGITVKTTDQFRRSSTQALSVLQWVPVGTEPTSPAGKSC